MFPCVACLNSLCPFTPNHILYAISLSAFTICFNYKICWFNFRFLWNVTFWKWYFDSFLSTILDGLSCIFDQTWCASHQCIQLSSIPQHLQLHINHNQYNLFVYVFLAFSQEAFFCHENKSDSWISCDTTGDLRHLSTTRNLRHRGRQMWHLTTTEDLRHLSTTRDLRHRGRHMRHLTTTRHLRHRGRHLSTTRDLTRKDSRQQRRRGRSRKTWPLTLYTDFRSLCRGSCCSWSLY